MNSSDIRDLFVRFFAEREHRNVPSSSLIPPPEEKTLLFTNAGMNQMKPYFMGMADPPAQRMTSIQKCFRTSDIEEVGDSSHCTFFEMLGNFSVGDYFKAEIIPWAFELLTAPEPRGMGLDPNRIWTTVFEEDDEAFELWRGCGIPEERIVRFDESENYWFMIKGGAGPCGPNTEIYYDFGVEHSCGKPDCKPPLHTPPDCGRFLEIWNLVFMSLYQEEDGKTRRPLPSRNVDTGGGLERWLPVYMYQHQVDWQGNPKQWITPPSIYDTDLFRPILGQVEQLSGLEYGVDANQDRSMRVVAEHARAATLLIADGVMPSNEGRGYVLRRLIRRGTSFAQRLRSGVQFLEPTATAVIDHLEPYHPNLTQQRSQVLRILRSEETRFQETIAVGRNQLEELKQASANKQIAGADVFQLWDTHGFPPELTMELLAEDGFTVPDPESFERLMDEQRRRSRAATKFEGDSARIQTYGELALERTEFLGYETTRLFSSIEAIVLDGTEPVQLLTAESAAGRRVEVVLHSTAFYAEGGGQVGDRGEIVWAAPQSSIETAGRFVVEDTQAVGEGGVTAHVGRLDSGVLRVGAAVEARVDADLRGDTMRNHTATHILHAALRQTLGSHVRQAGSLVTPDRLRFDFTHLEALTPDEIRQVETVANRVVRENLPVHVDYKRYEDALADGALAFFGDKYAAEVRVVGVCYPEQVEIDPGERCFSHELCGGTHVHASGDVGTIIITAETSIGAGLRRIEAVSGRAAAERLRLHEDALAGLSLLLKAPAGELGGRIEALQEENDRLRKQLQAAERRAAREASQAVDATMIGETAVIVQRLESSSADALREAGDALKSRYQSAVLVLAAAIDGKPAFLAMATPDVSKKVSAGEIVKVAAGVAGGGGGGRPEVAQGGGTDVSKIDAALAAGKKLIEEKLQAP